MQIITERYHDAAEAYYTVTIANVQRNTITPPDFDITEGDVYDTRKDKAFFRILPIAFWLDLAKWMQDYWTQSKTFDAYMFLRERAWEFCTQRPADAVFDFPARNRKDAMELVDEYDKWLWAASRVLNFATEIIIIDNFHPPHRDD